MKTSLTRLLVLIVFMGDLVFGAHASAGQDVSIGLTREWNVYLIHQTHLDIGYTLPQEEVLLKQWQHIENAMDLIEETASYPAGERFVWNPEATWAVSLWLEQATEEQKMRFSRYVKQGSIGLSATFASFQTYLLRPTEYYNQFQSIHKIERDIGVKIINGMYTDVPGWNWGTVAVFAQNGIRYLSLAPNDSDRIGNILKVWGDRPHWWVSPSGTQRVLVFPHKLGYAWAHEILTKYYLDEKCYPFPTKYNPTIHTAKWFVSYLRDLEKNGYPYSSIIIRYSVGGDNGPPDRYISSRIHRFNAENSKVKLILSSVDSAFEAFERENGDSLPEYRGDYSGYWEDGTYSSARETILTRSTSEKLASLELYNALHGFPINQETFWAAWQDILLFNEHTWGSHNSISAPDSDLTQKTWQWKSERAVNANRLTSQIWQQLIFDYSANEQDKVSQILVVNPHNIPIKQAVTVDNGIHRPGDQVVDLYGNLIDSQRLRNGALVFVAHLSPLEKRIYQITEGNASVQNLINFNISNNELSNNQISIKINPYKGAIESLVRKSDGYEFVNRQDNNLLAQHIYVPGSFGTIVQSTRNENIRVSVGESGPLVSSIRIDSQPHGSNSQILEIMLYQDSSRLDISFLLDRKKIRIKESVHYAFPLNIPNGSLFYDVPFGRVNLSQDMMPGGNRNFISVNRYLELSNDEVQATIVMQDAALVVPYKLNVDPKAVGWKNEFPEYNSKIYSYVMNNYWHTNFKADQEGLCQIRYSLWVGAKQDAAFSSKLATQVCQPLLVIPLKDGAVIPEEDVNLNSLLNQLSMHLDLEIVRLSEQSGVYEILLWNRSDQTQSVGSWTFAPYELKQYSFSLNFSQTL